MFLPPPPLKSPFFDEAQNIMKSWSLWFTQISDNFVDKMWTPTFTNLTIVGSVAIVGEYVITGNLLTWDVTLTPSGGGTVAAGATTRINNLPVPSANPSKVLDAYGVQTVFDVTTKTQIGHGIVMKGTKDAYLPAFGATPDTISLTGIVRTH